MTFIQQLSLLIFLGFYTTSLFAANNDSNHDQVKLSIGSGKLVNLKRNAKAVMIANETIANFQLPAPDKLYLMGVAPGQTDLTVLDINRSIIYQAKIHVSVDAKMMSDVLLSVFPNEKNVSLVVATDKIIVRGKVRSPRTAASIIELLQGYVKDEDAIINQLEVTMPTQVHVQLRLAEMSRTVSNRLGIRWGTNQITLVPNPSASAGGPAFLESSTFITDKASILRDNLFGGPTGIGAGSRVGGILEALNTRGLAKVLAEPSLTAMSGESASFLAGGEFPIPVYDGRDRIVVNYKQFGVLLEVSPTVLDDGRISIKITPEVSSLDFQSSVNAAGISLPTLKTRRADTTVELASGQSFVLAGLLRNDDINNYSELPFLADIPILGALFRSNDFQSEKTELVVLATAYLVEPNSADKFKLPTDNYSKPTALERMLFGRFNNKKSSAEAGKTTRSRLIGDNGFYY